LFSPVTDALDRLPNFHTALHLASNAKLFGSAINTCATFGEMKHRVWKNIVPHTNFREMDLAFSLYDNTMQSLRYLIDSTHSNDHHLARHPLAKVLVFLQANCGSIFSGQYFSGPKNCNSEELETTDDLIDLSMDWNIPHDNRYAGGKLWRKFSSKQVRKLGFIQNLCDVSSDDLLLLDFRRTYLRVFKSKPPLTAQKELGALQWWSKLTVFDNALNTRLTIRAGTIVSFRIDQDQTGNDEVIHTTPKC
jgi:hypothetical protein